MAKQAQAQSKKPNFFVRFGRGIKNLVLKMGHGLRNMYFELKKVTWPSKHDMINYCLVVFVFMLLMGCIIGLFDLGAGKLIDMIVY